MEALKYGRPNPAYFVSRADSSFSSARRSQKGFYLLFWAGEDNGVISFEADRQYSLWLTTSARLEKECCALGEQLGLSGTRASNDALVLARAHNGHGIRFQSSDVHR
jgi:hypothetical protein